MEQPKKPIEKVIAKMQEAKENFPAIGFDEEFVRGFNKAFQMAIFITEQVGMPLEKACLSNTPALSQVDKIDFDSLYEWLTDINREPAQTKFTSGKLRDIAKEIEFELKRTNRVKMESLLQWLEDNLYQIRTNDKQNFWVLRGSPYNISFKELLNKFNLSKQKPSVIVADKSKLNNAERQQQKIQFIKNNMDELAVLSLDKTPFKSNSNARSLVKRLRSVVSFSEKTVDCDIYCSIIKLYNQIKK